jgi:membrane AbrB-like protein
MRDAVGNGDIEGALWHAACSFVHDSLSFADPALHRANHASAAKPATVAQCGPCCYTALHGAGISISMTPATASRAPGLLGRLPRLVLWGLLVVLSVLLAGLLSMAGLPAAWLLGPMLAGILIATNGGRIRIPRPPLLAAQAILGCLVARAITADIVMAFVRGWPLFLGIVLIIIVTSALLGWLIARFRVLPGTTAVWGTAPGAASAMMVMAGDFGADPRLVAFMQYLRVVCVAGMASVVARVWVGASAAAHTVAWFPALHWADFGATLLLAAATGGLGVALQIPAGTLLLPMIIGGVLEGTGLVTILLPPWLLVITYAFLGWNVGLGFSREILGHAWRALPQVLVSIFIMIGVCGCLAFLLVRWAGVDPLTAYLATSPGGMDSIAIIGASSNVDLSFVMALQGARFLIVLVAGPPLARFVAERLLR